MLHDPHLIAVTETWLNKDISSDEVFPKSFNVLRKDRAARGGGVALLIKDTLRYEPLPLIDTHESMWCKLFVGDVVLVIGVVYRPPRKSHRFPYSAR